jgi:hypothetical protein
MVLPAVEPQGQLFSPGEGSTTRDETITLTARVPDAAYTTAPGLSGESFADHFHVVIDNGIDDVLIG